MHHCCLISTPVAIIWCREYCMDVVAVCWLMALKLNTRVLASWADGHAGRSLGRLYGWTVRRCPGRRYSSHLVGSFPSPIVRPDRPKQDRTFRLIGGFTFSCWIHRNYPVYRGKETVLHACTGTYSRLLRREEDSQTNLWDISMLQNYHISLNTHHRIHRPG